MNKSPSVLQDLGKKEMSDFHKAILRHCKELVDQSRRKMKNYYADWDRYDQVYRGRKEIDKADKAAINRKEPPKMVTPIAHSQIQTFVAFCYSLYTQREYFFELLGMSPEDTLSARYAEAAIQRDLDHNKFNCILYQFLIDIARFGVGVMKESWVEESQWVDQTLPAKQVKFLGLSMTYRQAQTERVQRTKYQGNKLVSVSPYRFFPDPRLPISRFQEGEFVASEDEYSYTDLKALENDGVIAGIDEVTTLSKRSNPDREGGRLFNVDLVADEAQVKPAAQSKGTFIITEVEVKLIPKNFQIDGKPMGEEAYPVKYLVWYANDQRVIRCEPLNYVHDEFTYSVAEFTPDMNHFINAGLSDIIDNLQDVITWLINSHISSVRKVIDNKLIVDPDAIEMDDLKERKPILRLKSGFGRMGVERWVKQLQVQDVTQNHMADAQAIQQLIQTVTGINDNLLGQFHTGRRSATEARQVGASTASRLKMVAMNIYTSAIEPLGRRMLSNLRDGLTEQTYVRMFGSDADPGSFFTLKQVSRDNLTGDYDFQLFDGTLPSEKSYQAQTLQEVLIALIGNPETIQLLQMNPQAMMLEILRLRGIRHPQRFSLQANPQMQAMVAQLMAQQTATQNANKDSNVQRNGEGRATPLPSPVAGASGNGAPAYRA